MPSNGRAAFGPMADRFSRCFSADDPVVAFDNLGVAEALRECTERRFSGRSFLVRPVLQREYAARVDALMPNVLASFSDPDERRAVLEQAAAGVLTVNNAPLRDLTVYPPATLRMMQAAIRLADGIVVSSQAERRRISDLLFVDPPAEVRALVDPSVPPPAPTATQRDAIVIWAPHLSADAAAAFVLPLSDMRLPVLVVAAAETAADILARAKLIVDASAFGCDAANALARWGVPLVADAESGAQERLANVRAYDRRRGASLFEAVIASLGSAPPRAVIRETPALDPQPGTDPIEGPLVSVIIPTVDRPHMLSEALDSVARQTYRNVETIVVIDGGPPLDAMAEAYPSVTFIHMPENDFNRSFDTAFARTRGEYVAFLNDDDLFFPNHLSALVGALERSGGAVAHGDVLTAYLRGSDTEGWSVYGWESNMSRAADRRGFMVSNQIGMTSCMFRRSCITDESISDNSVAYSRDFALWMRLAYRFDFLHVERLTSCYTIRNLGAAQASTVRHERMLHTYKTLYEKYPVTGRPVLERQRAQILQTIERGNMGLTTEPAAEIRPVRWPLWDDR